MVHERKILGAFEKKEAPDDPTLEHLPSEELFSVSTPAFRNLSRLIDALEGQYIRTPGNQRFNQSEVLLEVQKVIRDHIALNAISLDRIPAQLHQAVKEVLKEISKMDPEVRKSLI